MGKLHNHFLCKMIKVSITSASVGSMSSSYDMMKTGLYDSGLHPPNIKTCQLWEKHEPDSNKCIDY